MDYIQVTFRTENVEDYTNDVLAAALGEIGFECFEETARGIVGYCTAEVFDLEAMKTIIASLPISNPSLITFRTDTIADQNWNAVWEQNGYEPIVVNEKCIIHASDKQPDKEYLYNIIINPVQSFGSGYHETTRMILTMLMDDIETAGRSVLDMGCGTGILGIMASMRGAKFVTAIDIDEWSQRNAVENVKANRLTNILVLLGDATLLSSLEKFDLVLANINRNILLRDISAYILAMNDSAEIIMSGFYSEDLPMLRQQAETLGLKYVTHQEDNNWVAVRFKK